MREPTIDSVEDDPLDPGAERAQAIEGLEQLAEDNPYDAVGIRWGSFILKPTLETGRDRDNQRRLIRQWLGGGAVGNRRCGSTPPPTGRAIRPTIDAFGTFRKTLSGEEVDDVEGGVDAVLELELGDEYRARGTFDIFDRARNRRPPPS